MAFCISFCEGGLTAWEVGLGAFLDLVDEAEEADLEALRADLEAEVAREAMKDCFALSGCRSLDFLR